MLKNDTLENGTSCIALYGSASLLGISILLHEYLNQYLIPGDKGRGLLSGSGPFVQVNTLSRLLHSPNELTTYISE